MKDKTKVSYPSLARDIDLLTQFHRLSRDQQKWIMKAMQNFIERDEEAAVKASEEFIPYSPQEADKYRS